MGLDPKSRVRFNLSRTVILLLETTPMGMSILAQIVAGLGAKNLHRCASVAEAKAIASECEIDLMIVDSIAESGEGYEFISWLRRECPLPNKHTPVLLTVSHTRKSDVKRARDCGSHFIVAKPLAPIVMLERIVWVAKEGRAFLVSESYVGPDRRFSDEGRPDDLPGRRREDGLRRAQASAAEDGSPMDADNPALASADLPEKAA